MYKKQTWWSMYVVMGCIFAFAFFLVIGIFIGEIKVHRTSNRTSFQSAEVESNENNSPVRRNLGIFIVTAYCKCERCCGCFADGITASGHWIQKGDRFCAADESFPFGVMLDIPGYGFVPVWDRGGKIKGNRLDVYFDTHEEALEWGLQELEIFCWVKTDEEYNHIGYGAYQVDFPDTAFDRNLSD